jgi:hypothetical protein
VRTIDVADDEGRLGPGRRRYGFPAEQTGSASVVSRTENGDSHEAMANAYQIAVNPSVS